jgi:hypothetical protein
MNPLETPFQFAPNDGNAAATQTAAAEIAAFHVCFFMLFLLLLLPMWAGCLRLGVKLLLLYACCRARKTTSVRQQDVCGRVSRQDGGFPSQWARNPFSA